MRCLDLNIVYCLLSLITAFHLVKILESRNFCEVHSSRLFELQCASLHSRDVVVWREVCCEGGQRMEWLVTLAQCGQSRLRFVVCHRAYTLQGNISFQTICCLVNIIQDVVRQTVRHVHMLSASSSGVAEFTRRCCRLERQSATRASAPFTHNTTPRPFALTIWRRASSNQRAQSPIPACPYRSRITERRRGCLPPDRTLARPPIGRRLR